ncbi:hypothetical protein ACLOJK_021860 [Asimina triloba]
MTSKVVEEQSIRMVQGATSSAIMFRSFASKDDVIGYGKAGSMYKARLPDEDISEQQEKWTERKEAHLSNLPCWFQSLLTRFLNPKVVVSSDQVDAAAEAGRVRLWGRSRGSYGVILMQMCLQVISVMFVGHLGELALSGASMATSFAGVTSFSFMMGMASALVTLCGQAYGAKQNSCVALREIPGGNWTPDFSAPLRSPSPTPSAAPSAIALTHHQRCRHLPPLESDCQLLGLLLGSLIKKFQASNAAPTAGSTLGYKWQAVPSSTRTFSSATLALFSARPPTTFDRMGRLQAGLMAFLLYALLLPLLAMADCECSLDSEYHKNSKALRLKLAAIASILVAGGVVAYGWCASAPCCVSGASQVAYGRPIPKSTRSPPWPAAARAGHRA